MTSIFGNPYCLLLLAQYDLASGLLIELGDLHVSKYLDMGKEI